jgi:peptidoglycan/LPS O-acetylase OafA/YrhL
MYSGKSPQGSPLSGLFSSYLDFVRLASALAVVISHCYELKWQVGQMGIDAVSVFFVLSGLVISTITANRETAPIEYASARLARIYSILVPALIITYILDRAGMAMNEVAYADYVEEFKGWIEPGAGIGNYIASMLFLNQIWFVHSIPGTNAPIWSLTLEVWYYLIFGVMFFNRRSWAIILGVALFVIAGPKLILLAPCWFMGVGVAHIISHGIRKWLAWPLAILPLVLFIVANLFGFKNGAFGLSKLVGFDLVPYLWNSSYFLRVGFTASLASLHFIGMSAILADRAKGTNSRLISWAAQYTYSIYLFHYPIKVFVSAIPQLQQMSAKPYIILACAVVVPVFFGLAFEPLRYPLRRLISRSLNRIPALQSADRGHIDTKPVVEVQSTG